MPRRSSRSPAPGLAHYEREFVVPYPFGKYDQVFVPEFNFGAMENPGVVTFREDAYLYRSRVTEATRESRAMVIMHEMAHMWFGDLVTMRWWDDLWLNESFANWAGYGVAASATRFTEAWTTFALSQKAWAYVQDQLPSTHPVVADIPELEGLFQQFDGITYAKGASVLKQLVAYVGYDAFLAGVNRYFERHAWGNATLADLLVELEAASGRDLGFVGPGVAAGARGDDPSGARGAGCPGPLRIGADRAAAGHPARGRVPGAAPAPGRPRSLPMGRCGRCEAPRA